MFKKYGRSFYYAARGLGFAWREESHFRFQVFAALGVISLSFIFSCSETEKIALVIVSFLVLTLEVVNTAVEHLVDVVKPSLHHSVLIVKDLLAGSVLLSAVMAVAVAVIIFLTRLGSF